MQTDADEFTPTSHLSMETAPGGTLEFDIHNLARFESQRSGPSHLA